MASLLTRLILVLAAGLSLATGDAAASGDHHGAPAAAPVQVAPRGHARNDGVEAVAVAAPGRRLVLYLDNSVTNEPLVDANVAADADGFALTLRDVGDGVYVANDWYPAPGPNLLRVTYRVGERESRIEVTVDVPQTGGFRPAVQAAAAALRFEQANIGVIAAAALAVYLAAMMLFLWRSRRLRQPTR